MTKFLAISLLIIVLFFSCSQAPKQSPKGGYIISGTITGIKDNEFIYLQKDSIIDSALVKDSKFVFTGTINSKALEVILKTKDSRKYKFFWLENTPITITIENGNFSKAKIEGSATQIEQSKYNAFIEKYQSMLDSLQSIDTKGVVTDSIKNSAMINKALEDLYSATYGYVSKEPNSFINLDLFKAYYSVWGKEKAQVLFNQLTPENKNSAAGKEIEKFIAVNKKIIIGGKLADAQQFDIAGKPHQLSDYVGRVFLLNFWASWCVPCRGENLELVALYNKYHPKGFEVVAVSVDENKANWTKAVAQDKLPWINLSELNGGKNTASNIYGLSSYPSSFLIDRNGVITAINLSITDLDHALAKTF